MISFENVTFAYPNGSIALNSLNLHIERGEKVVIVGSNGSGKTTLALLINGVLRPTSGSIKVVGLDPSIDKDNKELKRKVGLVFQNPDNQLVSTTVEREVAFSLENMNVPHDQMHRRVTRMLEFFGLIDFRNKLTSDLSGGEKQRLALAAVMVAEPDILILDEPGSYLDQTGKRLLNKAIDLLLAEKEDLTVLRITQYNEEAESYNRMIVFRDGQIEYDNTPEYIFRNAVSGGSLGIDIPLKYRIQSRSASDSQDDSSPLAITDTVNQSGIIMDSVAFSYESGPGRRLFDNLNLKLTSGKVYGLVGPSGSGKTTLIQLLAGLIKPDSGKITYDGFKPAAGKLAVSFQQPERQFFLETVDREIRFGAENLGFDDIDKIAGQCYSLIGLDKDKYSNRNPFTLSGGEKRKLAFGTILSLKPKFIFFDEPTCGLDQQGIDKFKGLVARLKQNGIGMIIISHFGDIIFDLADEVIALQQGRIESVMTRRDFFLNVDYGNYLSTPDPVAYQKEVFGEIKYLSRGDLLNNI
ncbi:MAG: energy-coupling factor transporter ATPase [Candidatus Zixiibacteriota bacterium]